MSSLMLRATDHPLLTRRGLSIDEVQRQAELLREPPPPADLVRPCTVGDGIHRPASARHDELTRRWSEAAGSGRLRAFVPASGAASRMFRGLQAVRNQTATEADRDMTETALAAKDRFAFADQLRELTTGDEPSAWLDAMLDTDGLDLARLPKALIPFHRYPDGEVRTAFDEQLVEACHLVRADNRVCRLHFTVQPTAKDRFEQRIDRVASTFEQRYDVRYELSFSVQDPATDTIAVDPETGELFRDAAGDLVLRPGGHGALLRNLAALDGDIVLIKNIDNIQGDDRRPTVIAERRLLIGTLLDIQERIHGLLRQIDAGSLDDTSLEEGRRFAHATFGIPVENLETAEDLRVQLDRPLRACGMVVNEGEPGGGPFWVRSETGDVRAQIVESAQIDHDDPHQASLVAAATHFNPVDLVCAVRDHQGRSFDLNRFVDPRTVFIADKSQNGRRLRALEHPGLWNGAMAHWLTVFVEVPAATFAPVKTVLDLLRPQHQISG